MDRQIIHADLDCCYASIEILHHPKLRGRPVAVGGDIEARHGIILAKSYEAKPYGVSVGQAIWEAKQRCPGLIVVPPNYPLYMRVSRAFKNILSDYTDQLESFGLDEMWGDITHTWELFAHSPEELIHTIRKRVQLELGVTVSLGLSWNKIYAKLGSDVKKPNGCTVITRENYKDIVWPLPAEDLLGVGRATKQKLHSRGVYTIGDIANTDPKYLESWLHKWGLYLHTFANGWDISPVHKTGDEAIIKSVGNSVTAPRDLLNEQDCKIVFMIYAESVAERLRELGLACRTVQISLRDNQLISIERQLTLEWPTNLAVEICAAAMKLLKAHYRWQNPLRSLGVRGMNLVPVVDCVQMSLYEDEARRIKWESLEQTMDTVRNRFGRFSIRRAVSLRDPLLGNLNPRLNEEIHPVGYF